MPIETVVVDCGTCVFCEQPSGTVEVPVDGFINWNQKGMHIQDAFPDLPAGIREQMISGTHEKCFDEAFPEDDEPSIVWIEPT